MGKCSEIRGAQNKHSLLNVRPDDSNLMHLIRKSCEVVCTSDKVALVERVGKSGQVTWKNWWSTSQ